jgi:hypothetical protein
LYRRIDERKKKQLITTNIFMGLTKLVVKLGTLYTKIVVKWRNLYKNCGKMGEFMQKLW